MRREISSGKSRRIDSGLLGLEHYIGGRDGRKLGMVELDIEGDLRRESQG